MAKRTELKCPYCDTVQMRVKNCKEAELLCHNCGASLLITKDECGALYISARPQDYEPPKIASGAVKQLKSIGKNLFALQR